MGTAEDDREERADAQTGRLEEGNIYFFYRPRVEKDDPEGIEDIQRLFVVLSPDEKDLFRLIVVGRKKLPDPGQSGNERFWGYVQAIASDPEPIRDELAEQEYDTKTRGHRRVPASRPAGEGRYRIFRHSDHTHLAYALELPRKPGEVQHELEIEKEASYIISVKNPERGSPRGAGLPGDEKADYPPGLERVFRGRAFSELDPPDLLDRAGAEFVLISSAGDAAGGTQAPGVDPEPESPESADLFRELRLERDRPVKPLFEGDWE